MAESITRSNVVDMKRPRGRPKGSGKKVADALAKADAIMASVPKKGAAKVTPPEIVDNDPLGANGPATDERRAPAFGANEPDIGVFLKHVQIARKDKEEEDHLKLQLKNRKKITKDHRQEAKAVGIVLGEMDRAMKDADTEDVDLVAREQRYMTYMSWLGKPLDTQGEIDVNARQTPEQVKKHWFTLGDRAGRLGKNRDAYPEGIPPEYKPDHLAGWDHGQTMLMRDMPLTAGAFKDKAAAAPAEASSADGSMLVLREANFQGGTPLEDANLKTLLPGMHEAFWNADSVVAIFGDSKKILKEPDAQFPNGVFVDTGEPDAPESDIEPVSDGEAEASQFA